MHASVMADMLSKSCSGPARVCQGKHRQGRSQAAVMSQAAVKSQAAVMSEAAVMSQAAVMRVVISGSNII